MAKAHANSWEVTDEFWEQVEPLIPQPARDLVKAYRRRAGADRPAKPPKLVFKAIVYVLRTGCHRRGLPAEPFGSASAIHQKFMLWSKAGFFEKLWKAGLAEYDELECFAWPWQSVDGAIFTPLGARSHGTQSHGPAKKGQQAPKSQAALLQTPVR